MTISSGLWKNLFLYMCLGLCYLRISVHTKSALDIYRILGPRIEDVQGTSIYYLSSYCYQRIRLLPILRLSPRLRMKICFPHSFKYHLKRLNNTLQYFPNKLSLCIEIISQSQLHRLYCIQVSQCYRIAYCQRLPSVCQFMVILSSSTHYKHNLLDTICPTGWDDKPPHF